jgi:uncharacterized protein DUF1569
MHTFARDADVQQILRRLRAVTPASARRWGRMSAHQMVCHLSDSCRMAMGEKPAQSIARLHQRTVIKWLALYLPRPWPPGIETVPEVDQMKDGTCPTDFAHDLADAETLMRGIAARRNASWPRHPIFGRMSEAQWLRWAYLHADHHLRQFNL